MYVVVWISFIKFHLDKKASDSYEQQTKQNKDKKKILLCFQKLCHLYVYKMQVLQQYLFLISTK